MNSYARQYTSAIRDNAKLPRFTLDDLRAARAQVDMDDPPAWPALLDAAIAAELPENYVSDLLVHDYDCLHEQQPPVFGWMVRENGTHILLPGSAAHVKTVQQSFGYDPLLQWYYWDGATLHPSSATAVQAALAAWNAQAALQADGRWRRKPTLVALPVTWATDYARGVGVLGEPGACACGLHEDFCAWRYPVSTITPYQQGAVVGWICETQITLSFDGDGRQCGRFWAKYLYI